MADDARQFAAEVDQYHEAILNLEQSTIKQALASLDEARAEINGRIAEGGATELDAFRFRQLQMIISARLHSLQFELTGAEQAAIRQAAALGQEMMSRGAAALGVAPTGVPISSNLVQIASGYAADRITALTAEIQSGITQVLKRAAIGVITPKQAMLEVGKSLNSPGVFRSIAARAEAIVRTETLMIQAQASQAQMTADAARMSAAGYTLKKSWLSARDLRVRPAHVLADATYNREGTTGPIPVDQPFIVDGEELMYPHDPAGSPGNIINCRCVSVPVVERAD